MKQLYFVLIAVIVMAGCEKPEIPIIENTFHLTFDLNNPDTLWIADLEDPFAGWVPTANGTGEFTFEFQGDTIVVESRNNPESVVYWVDALDRHAKPVEFISGKNKWKRKIHPNGGFTVKFY